MKVKRIKYNIKCSRLSAFSYFFLPFTLFFIYLSANHFFNIDT